MFSGYASGGQLMLTSDVENFPGYPQRITGPEMMMHLREQAERFGCEVIDKNVASVDFSSSHSKLQLKMKFLSLMQLLSVLVLKQSG